MINSHYRRFADNGHLSDGKQDVDNITQVHLNGKHAFLMIARALDKIGGTDKSHGHRVALISHICAEHLGWPPEKRLRALCAGLIHDCGVSSTGEYSNLMSQMHPKGWQQHCVVGATRLHRISLLKSFATIVAHHHTPYRELLDTQISDEDRDIAALIFLSDRIDFLRNELLAGESFEQAVLYKNTISNILQNGAGTTFDPRLVIAMQSVLQTDAFWFQLDCNVVEKQLYSLLSRSNMGITELGIDEVYQLARFIAEIIDEKSNFTYQHSVGVGRVSKALATILGRPIINQQLIEIAGLLHDVGKLGTPDHILHKPGKLTNSEYAQMRLHAQETQQILFDCFNGHPLVSWAANHHECLDGSGYPNSYQAKELDMESRIVAMADIFQALSEHRPYREMMPMAQRLNIIRTQVESGKLDSDVFSALQIFVEGNLKLTSANTNVEAIGTLTT